MSKFTRCVAPNGMLTPETSAATARTIAGLHGLGRLCRSIRRLHGSTVLWHAANAKALWNVSGFRSSQEILEVAVLSKDVAECLVHDFIGRSVKKCRVLVDQNGGGFIEPDAGGNLADLGDFKQWHLGLSFPMEFEFGLSAESAL